jgi:hypothetical protein
LSIVKLPCRGCGTDQEFNLPDGVAPPLNFLCRDCADPRSMVDNIDWSEIGKTRLARKLAWQREAEAQREVRRQGGEPEDGYAVYKRKKDRACKFRRRNGFTLMQWHERIDSLGWRCFFCGRDLTKMTVLRWSVDGSKELESQVPVCRSCQCKRIGPKRDRCPTTYIYEGDSARDATDSYTTAMLVVPPTLRADTQPSR